MTPPDPFNGGRQEDLDTVVTPRHRPYVVNDEAITIAAVSGLVSLARHARDRAAAGGNAILRATLLPATNALVEIGHNRDHGLVRTRSRVPMPDSVTAESVVPLDALADAGPTLAGAAASLVDEIGQAFGIPELGQLGRDGRLRSRYWSHFWSGQVIHLGRAAQHRGDQRDARRASTNPGRTAAPRLAGHRMHVTQRFPASVTLTYSVAE